MKSEPFSRGKSNTCFPYLFHPSPKVTTGPNELTHENDPTMKEGLSNSIKMYSALKIKASLNGGHNIFSSLFQC